MRLVSANKTLAKLKQTLKWPIPEDSECTGQLYWKENIQQVNFHENENLQFFVFVGCRDYFILINAMLLTHPICDAVLFWEAFLMGKPHLL